MLLSPAASPPEVQQMSLSPVASPPAPLPITIPPPIFSPISPEVSLPPPPPPLPPSPAFPPELPPPNFPAISLPAPPPLPISTPIPVTLSPPELPPEVAPPPLTLPITSPPLPPRPPPIPLPIPTSQPPPAASLPLIPSPPQPSSPPELSQPPPWKPKHLPSPELSQPPPWKPRHLPSPELSHPPPWKPKHLPSPELKTHLPISPQKSADPKFLSAPPTTTPNFFPLTNGPPPPALVASSPPSVTSPTLSSSDFTAVRNQTTLDSEQSHHVSTGIVLGCVLGGVLLIAVAAVLYLCCRNRKPRKKTDNGKPWLGLKDTSCAVLPEQSVPSMEGHIVTIQPKSQSSPHLATCNNSGSQHQFQPQNLAIALSLTSGTFTYDELEVATNGFSQVNLLGEGGFGYVYKGVISNGREIAVKKLKTSSKQGEREFQAEVETFSQVHHKHLVTLVGYCITGSERLLVYDFIPNKTLEFHLHGKEQPTVEWATRLKIAVGSAKGLAYLHEDCNPTIIHRDIKAANILLDFKFDAKVSDFGLAKFFSDNTKSSCITHISTRVVGTFGYLAPEYASSGKVTEKSDVYSFGVMLLELITGSPPICTSQEPVMNDGLVGWARPLLTQALEDGNYSNLADPNLQGNYNTSEMASMVACAAACVRHSAWLRPRMSQIVRTLQGDVSPAHLNDGPRPGHSMIFGASESSSTYDANQYKEDLKKYNRALVSLEHGITRYSGSTSEFGLNQSESGSSCEMQRST